MAFQKEFHEKILKVFENVPDMKRLGFMAGFFKTGPEDYTDEDYVNFDVVNGGARLMPSVHSLAQDGVKVENDVFVGNQLKPPVYIGERNVNVLDLMRREPGESEYEMRGSWSGRLFKKLKDGFVLLHNMIVRSIELQAAQVLQTGQITLTDEKGGSVGVLDMNIPATHIKNATTMWDQASADPIADLEGLADSIQSDGYADATTLVFGRDAWHKFLENAKVKPLFDKESLNLAAATPGLENRGAKYMGYVNIGAYRFECWLYNAAYQDFLPDATTGKVVTRRYMDPKKVVMLADKDSLDFRLVYGGVPEIPSELMSKGFFPSQVTYPNGVRFHNNAFFDERLRTWVAQTITRPVCIPVSAARFGCLTVLA